MSRNAGLLGHQASCGQRVTLDLFPSCAHLLVPPKEDVRGRQVVQRFVVAAIVVGVHLRNVQKCLTANAEPRFAEENQGLSATGLEVSGLRPIGGTEAESLWCSSAPNIARWVYRRHQRPLFASDGGSGRRSASNAGAGASSSRGRSMVQAMTSVQPLVQQGRLGLCILGYHFFRHFRDSPADPIDKTHGSGRGV